MLTITPEALDVIERVTGNPRLQPSPGLRIAQRRDSSAPLEVRAVPAPAEGDRVVQRRGGRLYVDPRAARRIEDRELDAVTDEQGRVQFVLTGA